MVHSVGRWLFRDFWLKLAAAALVFPAWWWAERHADEAIQAPATLELHVRSDQVVHGLGNMRVVVVAAGSPLALARFRERRYSLRLDLTKQPYGRQDLDVSRAIIDLPAGLKIKSIHPAKTPIEVVPLNKGSL